VLPWRQDGHRLPQGGAGLPDLRFGGAYLSFQGETMRGTLTRVLLLVATNLAVLGVLTRALRLLGLDRLLEERTGYDLPALLLFSAVIGFGGALVSLVLSKWMAKTFMRARVIETPRSETEVWLVATVRRLARQAGVGMPEVAVYDSPDLNAFATGARRNHALVAVSTGLLRAMERQEAEAVLGHEISHVANGDMVTLTLIQGVLNTFVIFLSRLIGYAVDKLVFRTERGHGPGFLLTVLVTQLLLGILATLVVLWFSRQRELRADKGSARLVGSGRMIAALERLKGVRGPPALPDSMRVFGIRDRGGFSRLFLSHPPLDERIARLRGMSPSPS